MNGIKMKDCRFYVNEPERTVVCVIPYTQNMLLHFIHDNFRFKDLNISDTIEFNGIERHLKMPRTFIGKAVCAPEDNWDEDLGKMIAFSRAKDKCYKSFFKRANTFVQAIDRRLGDMIETFNDFGLKLEDKREGMKQRIDELTGVLEDTEEE